MTKSTKENVSLTDYLQGRIENRLDDQFVKEQAAIYQERKKIEAKKNKPKYPKD